MSQQITRTDLPAIIRQYIDRQRVRDSEEAIVTFSPDAIVVDDGQTYAGTSEIRSWLDTAASEFTYTTTEAGHEKHDDEHFAVHTHLEGNFPGGVADLTSSFTLSNGLISRLEIA